MGDSKIFNSRLNAETHEQLDELKDHFNALLPYGKTSKREIIEKAIDEVYKREIKEDKEK